MVTTSSFRAPFLIGVIGVLVFWIIVFALGFAVQDYGQLESTIGILTARGAPFAGVAQLAYVALGIGVLVFALGLHKTGVLEGPGAQLALAMFVIHGIGRLAEGAFPLGGSQLVTQLRAGFGIPGVLMMLLIPFALYKATDGRTGATWLDGARTFSAIFLFVFIVGFFGPLAGLPIPTGLGERAGFLVWYGWMIGIAWQLLRGPEVVEGDG